MSAFSPVMLLQGCYASLDIEAMINGQVLLDTWPWKLAYLGFSLSVQTICGYSYPFILAGPLSIVLP